MLSYVEDFDKDVCWIQVEGPRSDSTGRPQYAKGISAETHRYNYETMREPLGATQIVCICKQEDCVNPWHYEKRKPQEIRKNCKFCGREMRRRSVPKAKAPHALAYASNGLCQSCYKAGYGYIGADYDIEPLSEEQQDTVRRTVPSDLWSYFDV